MNLTPSIAHALHASHAEMRLTRLGEHAVGIVVACNAQAFVIGRGAALTLLGAIVDRLPGYCHRGGVLESLALIPLGDLPVMVFDGGVSVCQLRALQMQKGGAA